MTKKKNSFARTVFIMLATTAVMIAGATYARAASPVPLPVSNTYVSGVSQSALTSVSNGYVRVFSDSKKVYAENYDDSFNITGRRELPKELSMYGGFYSGCNAYYLVFGQANEKEDNNTEGIRVVKYDKNWKRMGVAKLKGDSAFAHEVRYPFEAGNMNIAEYGGMLYLVTGHEGYVDESVGQGHQGFLMYKINESTMKGEIVDADLYHSFSQHIAIKDQNNIYTVELSEGSRCAKLTKRSVNDYNGDAISVLDYGGKRTSAWSIPTYSSVDGVAATNGNVLTVGSSIDQSRYLDETYTKEYGIYITKTPTGNFTKEATTFSWLTDKKVQSPYKGIKITKVNDKRFMVSWSERAEEGTPEKGKYSGLETGILHYVFVNENGAKISKEFTVSGSISECDPIVKKGKIVFYTSDEGSVVFYSTDAESGAVSKKEHLTAGPSAVWEFKNGVLTISGTGEIKEGFADDSLSAIKPNIKKIIVKKGITKISDKAFYNMGDCPEVILEDGVTEIGDKAFYGNYDLKKITIPSSVRKIADNAFDTGYYWTSDESPVRRVTIICEPGSYAEAYAKNQGVSYQTSEKDKDEYTQGGGGNVPSGNGEGGSSRLRIGRRGK